MMLFRAFKLPMPKPLFKPTVRLLLIKLIGVGKLTASGGNIG